MPNRATLDRLRQAAKNKKKGGRTIHSPPYPNSVKFPMLAEIILSLAEMVLSLAKMILSPAEIILFVAKTYLSLAEIFLSLA